MKLEDIGFYTLSDERARNTSPTSPMWRCELIVTDKCNFKCSYCRGLASDRNGELPLSDAMRTLGYWCKDSLQNVRFSGGEPTLYTHLGDLVRFAVDAGVKRIAISTNGSAERYTYGRLLEAGVNDFSVSLDACCASFADRMAGCECKFDRLVENIRWLSSRVYTTVGVVLNEQNISEVKQIVEFADGLGVADIRIIPAAQFGASLSSLSLDAALLDRHPILRYRLNNAASERSVRGLTKNDTNRCYLVQDDCAVAGKYHFPCIIYLRENGDPIGRVDAKMRKDRVRWAYTHDTQADPICKANCLDVCRDYNNRVVNHMTDEDYAYLYAQDVATGSWGDGWGEDVG